MEADTGEGEGAQEGGLKHGGLASTTGDGGVECFRVFGKVGGVSGFQGFRVLGF